MPGVSETGGWERFGGASLIASGPLLLGGLAVAPLSNGGGAQVAIAALAIAFFTIGMVGLRHRIAGHGLSAPFLGLSILAIVAEIVGTTLEISGVLLSVPVVAVALFVIWRSDWRLGDLAVLGIVLGGGLGIAYVIEAELHPNTGSYGDQGAIMLVGLGVLISSIVITMTRSLPVWARMAVAIGPPLGIVALLLGSPVLGVASVALFGGGLAWVGLDLWSAHIEPHRVREA